MFIDCYHWDKSKALKLHRKLTNEHFFLLVLPSWPVGTLPSRKSGALSPEESGALPSWDGVALPG
ncbi:hypothetical protein MAR_027558 [Mya arenaria]|uniref:Uncharacterized protein n=1 Tax=Mya arenaria TaxID=6604 RepID=A0ABY7ETU7_MYAAR|nr:hypothetical protein MAR_027558 [Mya arenaria]